MNWSSINTKPKVLIGISIPTLFMLALGVIAITSIGKITTTTGWVNHTYNVLSKAEEIVASAVDMETGMRGYLLAGREEFLDPYKSGEQTTYERIEALQRTVSDNPGQVARLGEVESVLREWQSEVTEPAIQLRRNIGDAQTMNDMAELVGQAKGKTFFDKFRGQIATFVERERVLLEQREADFARLLQAPSVESESARETIGWVTHTYRVIAQAKSIIAAAVDMETGMRGYLLAGKEEFLEPYHSGSAQFFKLTESLRETVSDNPAQVTLLGEVDETIKAWQTEVTEPMIQLRREIGDSMTMDDMADLVGEARGKVFFDRFRALMADFSAEEAALMEVRKQENLDTKEATNFTIAGGILMALLLGSGIGWAIGNSIAGPICQMTTAMGRLAEGKTSTEVPGTSRGDEVGLMAKAVQVFKDSMIKADELAAREAEESKARNARAQKIEQLTKEFDVGVTEMLTSVTSSSMEMEKTAGSMSDIAEDTSKRAETVSIAADQASSNVQAVATATDELSSSIGEIGRQVSQSSEIVDRAVSEADKTNQQIQGLVEASNKIGEVVNLISDIAEQTNLLALNATIEAARAGDAGKGFAVVAHEVKNLAEQTAKATDEISQQIGGIQAETQTAVSSIQSIGATIKDTHEIASAIASAVEEQGAATAEIARNVAQASASAAEVSSNIGEVTRASGETGTAATQVSSVARDMNQKADGLKDQVERFLSEVRAA